jgi:hypothetical protein
MEAQEELEALRKKCIKNNGEPKKTATKKDLNRIVELEKSLGIEPTIEAPVDKRTDRKKHGTFFEAWAKVKELRKWCTREGTPRLGLNQEGIEKANKLIEEYKHG